MIIVLGQVRVDPSDVKEFLKDIQAIDPTRMADSRCLFYSVAADDKDAGRMMVAERWQDQDALTDHLEQPNVRRFEATWSGRMTGDVRRYDASNERALKD